MAATPTYLASSSNATSPITLTASASGDLLLLFTKDGAGTTEVVTSVTDSISGTWTLVSAAPSSGSTGRRVEIWTKMNSAPITSVTVSFTGTATAHIALIKLEGVTHSGATGPAATTFQTATTTPTELKITLPQANMLTISVFQCNSNTQAQHVQESGWTKGTTSSTGPAWAWRNDLGAVNDGCAWTVTSSFQSGTGIIAFRAKPTGQTVPQTLFGSQVPSLQDWSDGPSTHYTLGTRFNPLTPIRMTHFRWYIPETAQPSGGVLTFGLWDNATSSLLFSQTYDSAGHEDQWVQVPVSGGPYWLSDSTASGYTVSVYTPNRFVSTASYTWSSAGTSGIVTCPDPAGYFDGSLGPVYPTLTFGSTNYFADFVYDFGDVGLPVTVWNGTSELATTITVWDGTSEVTASFDSIVA